MFGTHISQHTGDQTAAYRFMFSSFLFIVSIWFLVSIQRIDYTVQIIVIMNEFYDFRKGNRYRSKRWHMNAEKRTVKDEKKNEKEKKKTYFIYALRSSAIPVHMRYHKCTCICKILYVYKISSTRCYEFSFIFLLYLVYLARPILFLCKYLCTVRYVRNVKY